MKKELLALLLILVLLLSACAAPAGPDAGQSAAGGGASAAASKPAAPSEETVETAEESAETPSAPEIVIMSRYDSRYDSDLGVYLAKGNYPLLYCGDQIGEEEFYSVRDDAAYPALAAALRAYNEETEKLFAENLDSLESYARGDLQYGALPDAAARDRVYTSDSRAWLVRADETLVSFCIESYWDSGGAHPFTGRTGLNLDAATGRRLEFKDMLTEQGEELFPSLFEKALEEQYPYFTQALLVDSVQDAIRAEMNDGLLYFTADEQGITVLVNQYDLAPYAAGPAFVRMFFADYPGVFAPEYSAAHDEWARQLRPQGESGAYSELNTVRYRSGDRERELSVVFTPVDYSAGTAGSISVTLDGAVWEVADLYCFGVSPCLMRAEWRELLYLEYRLPNDWTSTYVLDLSGESPHLIDELQEGFYNQVPTDPHSFWLTTRSYCMSTYTITRRYAVSERGEPGAIEELYTALRAPELTLLTDMDMTLLSPDGGEKNAAVPAGTKLTIYRTNNKDLVDLISAEGEIYRVGFDRSKDFMGEVNGVPLQEAFDGLFFAG